MGDSGEDSEVVMIVVGGAGYDDGSFTFTFACTFTLLLPLLLLYFQLAFLLL